MMKIIKCIVFLGFFGFSCTSNQSSNEQGLEETLGRSKDSVSNKSQSDSISHIDLSRLPNRVSERIIDEVNKLPEIQECYIFIDSLTNGEKGLSVLIDEYTDSILDYSVQVGYSSELKFETFYHLYIDTLPFKILIEDYLEGDIVDFDTWRKREQNR